MNPKYTVAIATVAAFGCGVGAGHVLTKLHLTRAFEAELTEQEEKAKRYYSKLYKGEEFSTPEGARKALEEERSDDWVEDPDTPPEAREAMIRYSGKTVPGIVDPDERVPKKSTADIYQSYADKRKEEAETLAKKDPRPPLPEVPGIQRQNVFSPDHPALGDPQYVVDEEARKSQKPFIMSYEEYHADRHYKEAEMMYYAGDNTLADDNDEPIDAADLDRMFGEANLRQFDSAQVVYICNPGLGMKWEIIRTDAEFAEAVAGFTDDPKTGEGDSG